MSTISVGPSGAATVPAKAMISVRRGSLAAFAAAGLLVAMGAGLLLATSDHLVDPIAFGIQRGRDGRGMVQRGALLAGSTPWQSPRPLPSGAGGRRGRRCRFRGRPSRCSAASVCWSTSPSFVLCFYVIFAFPDGSYCRVASEGAARRDVALSTGVVLPSGSSSRPSSSGGGPLAGCNAACPANGFMIADRPTIADGFLSEGLPGVLPRWRSLRSFVYLIYRLATATRPRRRALLPVYVPALIASRPVVVFHGTVVELVRRGCGPASRTWGWLAIIGFSALFHTDLCFRSW